MEELIQLIQKEAPFILNRVVGIDVIQKDMAVIPVLVISIENGIGLIPIVNGNMPAIYLPDEDKFVPLTKEVFDSISYEENDTFIPAEPKNIDNNPNLYNMIRPPASGRAVYAEEEVQILTEPVAKEYFEFGFIIKDPRNKEQAPKVYVNPVESMMAFSKPELGKPQVIFSIDGEPIKAVIFKDSDSEHYLIISEIGAAHKVTKLPVACAMSCGCWPEYEPSEKFVVIYGEKYWDKPDETIFGPEDEVVFSDKITKPIVTSFKAIFPKNYQKLNLPIKEISHDAFAYDPVFVADILSKKCVRIHYMGGGEFLLGRDLLSKINLVKKLLDEFKLHAQDIYQIIKTAQEEGTVEFYVSKMEDTIKEIDPESVRKEELIEAFDSQMRALLNNYLEGLDTSRTMEIIKSLTNAITASLQ